MNGIILNHESQPKWSGCWERPVNSADSIINNAENDVTIQDLESKNY